MKFIGTLRFISHLNNSNGMRACIPARIREKPGPFTRPPPRARIQLKGEGSGNETSYRLPTLDQRRPLEGKYG